MADEAVIRIVLDATQAATAQSTSPPTAPPPRPTSFVPPEPTYEERAAERQRARAEREATEVAEVSTREAAFRQQGAESEAESRASFAEPATVEVSESGDSFEDRRAARELARATSQAAEDAEYERRLADIRAQEFESAEEARLSFDPVEVAKARVEAEESWQAATAEYAKIDARKAQNGLDAMLEALEGVRGTVGAVGGAFGGLGRVAGVALDASAKLRAMRAGRSAAMERLAPTAEVAAARTPEQDKELDAEISKLEGFAPEAGSPMDRKLQSLKGERAPPQATPLTGEEAKGLQAAAGAATSKLAMMATAVSVATVAFNLVSDAVNKSVNRYAEFSPEVAQAQALAEIRTMVGDMRRARDSGLELAQFVKAQSEMQNHWEDLKMSAMKKIIPVMTGLLEVINSLFSLASSGKDDEVQDPTEVLLNSGLELRGINPRSGVVESGFGG